MSIAERRVMQHNVTYTFLFAAAICIVCGIMVSTSAVTLADRQEQNATLDKMKNVLTVSGLAAQGEKLSADDVRQRFENIKAMAINLETGEANEEIDTETYDQRAAAADPEMGHAVEPNTASIKRLPNHVVVYEIRDESGNPKMLVLPIQGYGLWSTLYGFLAIDMDLNTVRGISYYEHGETAGLGGEVDNPRWKALWPGRKLYDENGEVALKVIKGSAGPADSNPFQVDGLSGATLTANGVKYMVDFWFSGSGYGPFLKKYAESHKAS